MKPPCPPPALWADSGTVILSCCSTSPGLASRPLQPGSQVACFIASLGPLQGWWLEPGGRSGLSCHLAERGITYSFTGESCWRGGRGRALIQTGAQTSGSGVVFWVGRSRLFWGGIGTEWRGCWSFCGGSSRREHLHPRHPCLTLSDKRSGSQAGVCVESPGELLEPTSLGFPCRASVSRTCRGGPGDLHFQWLPRWQDCCVLASHVGWKGSASFSPRILAQGIIRFLPPTASFGHPYGRISLKVCLFIYGCARSLLLREDFLQLGSWGATLPLGA